MAVRPLAQEDAPHPAPARLPHHPVRPDQATRRVTLHVPGRLAQDLLQRVVRRAVRVQKLPQLGAHSTSSADARRTMASRPSASADEASWKSWLSCRQRSISMDYASADAGADAMGVG